MGKELERFNKGRKMAIKMLNTVGKIYSATMLIASLAINQVIIINKPVEEK